MDAGGVQFQVPSDIPKMEVDLSKAPMVSKQGVDPKKREKALTYFRKHNIAIFLDCVLTELYLERPDDPICWFLRFLTKHDVFEELLQSRMFLVTRPREAKGEHHPVPTHHNTRTQTKKRPITSCRPLPGSTLWSGRSPLSSSGCSPTC